MRKMRWQQSQLRRFKIDPLISIVWFIRAQEMKQGPSVPRKKIYLFSLSLDLTSLTGTISFMIQSMYFCVGKGQAQRCPRLV